MKHRTGLPAAIGTLIAAMFSTSATAAVEGGAVSIEHWPSVPDARLQNLRGGLDLGPLMASFAIERLVRIDGQIVARTQLIITGLDRLAYGGLPDIRLVGNLANLVQIGLGNLMVDVGIEPGAPAAAAASPGSSGAVSATGIASGSMAQFGAGLALGVAAANADLPSPSPAPSGTPAGAAPATAPPAAPATAAAAAAPPSGSSITVPVGNTGQVIVISAIPDASTLATSIQNSVQATRIETQTSIDATLGSLAALRSVNFAASLRQQAIDSVRR